MRWVICCGSAAVPSAQPRVLSNTCSHPHVKRVRRRAYHHKNPQKTRTTLSPQAFHTASQNYVNSTRGPPPRKPKHVHPASIQLLSAWLTTTQRGQCPEQLPAANNVSKAKLPTSPSMAAPVAAVSTCHRTVWRSPSGAAKTERQSGRNALCLTYPRPKLHRRWKGAKIKRTPPRWCPNPTAKTHKPSPSPGREAGHC